jgi:hypothetical protein
VPYNPDARFSFWSPNVLFSIIFTNILAPCPLLNVADQVSLPYKLTG